MSSLLLLPSYSSISSPNLNAKRSTFFYNAEGQKEFYYSTCIFTDQKFMKNPTIVGKRAPSWIPLQSLCKYIKIAKVSVSLPEELYYMKKEQKYIRHNRTKHKAVVSIHEVPFIILLTKFACSFRVNKTINYIILLVG